MPALVGAAWNVSEVWVRGRGALLGPEESGLPVWVGLVLLGHSHIESM